MTDRVDAARMVPVESRSARLARTIFRAIAGTLVLLGQATYGFAAEPGVPTTALEAGPYARAAAVLVVRVTDVNEARAPQIVRARVLKSLKGTVTPGNDVAILVVGQRPTLDPARPSVPYFRKGQRERFVVFLGRGRGRYAWQLQTLYDAEGRVGDEKIAAVAAVASWASIEDGDAKARGTLEGLLEMLKGRGRWIRPHAARELAYLAGIRPDVFDRRTIGQLSRLAAVGGNDDLRFWLRRVTQVLQQVKSAGAAKAAEDAQTDPWRAAFEAAPEAEDRRLLLQRLLDTDPERFGKHGWWAWVRLEPSSRLWLLDGFVLARWSGVVPRLRALYGLAESGEVRERIVRTVGLLGGAEDVDWLGKRLAGPRSRRSALIALARIRTPAALTRLRKARANAPESEVRWIDFLLSEAFPTADRKG